MIDLRAKLEGGVWGLLVGDAVGVPYEFNDPRNLSPSNQIDMVPPAGFRISGDCPPHGTWSDDGSQALCLLASLLERGTLDLADFAQRIMDWLDRGYLAVDNIVFDVGVQTQHAIKRLRAGVSPHESGGKGERDNGNGSLMRVLPLVLWHKGDDAELARDAALQSLPTHAHLRSQVCCALYSVWSRRILEEHADPWQAAVATMQGLYASGSAEREELDGLKGQSPAVPGNGTGYVVETLRGARWCLETNRDFESVVRCAIALGWDTDTTACVAGGVAGIRHGVDGIPLRWRGAMRGRELAEPLVERLIRHRER